MTISSLRYCIWDLHPSSQLDFANPTPNHAESSCRFCSTHWDSMYRARSDPPTGPHLPLQYTELRQTRTHSSKHILLSKACLASFVQTYISLVTYIHSSLLHHAHISSFNSLALWTHRLIKLHCDARSCRLPNKGTIPGPRLMHMVQLWQWPFRPAVLYQSQQLAGCGRPVTQWWPWR